MLHLTYHYLTKKSQHWNYAGNFTYAKKISIGISIEATNMNLTKLREPVEDRRAWCALSMGSQRVRHDLTTK